MDIEPVHTVDSNGDQYWQVDGKYHRADGPAIIWADGTHQWCVDSQLHRTDGPAVIMADGHQEWWVNGKRHRIDGPAFIQADGHQEWWVNGNNITAKAEQWMELNEIPWPWDELTQVEFLLSWT